MMRALLLILAIAAPAAVAEAPMLLSTGVVLDREGAHVVLSAPDLTIESRNAADGALRWRAERTGLVLGLVEGAVFALAPTDRAGGRVLVLSPVDGSELAVIDLPLPQQVYADPRPEPDRRFLADLHATAAGLELHWQYEQRPLRGALLADDDPAVALSGVLALGLAERRAHSLDRPVRPTIGRLHAVAPSERRSDIGGQQFYSLDQRHLVGIESLSDAVVGYVYRWRVLTRDGGVDLGAAVLPEGGGEFLVQDGALLLTLPPRLVRLSDGRGRFEARRIVVLDLAAGRERWRADLYDPVYRGPLPP